MADLNPTERLIDLLNISGGPEARTDEDIFVGHSPQGPSRRVFGGQVLGQSVVAASRTVDEERQIHSLHGYFLRPGDIDKPITFGVQRLRDGRSFSARRVHAYQDGVPILSMIASFEVPSVGIEHQTEFPENIPAPEDLPPAAQWLEGIDHPAAKDWRENRPFDFRYIDEPIFFKPAADPFAGTTVWIKTKDPLPAGTPQAVHRAALAYASDYTLLESVMRRHNLVWTTPGMSIASLDHAMWWHRPVAVDEWMLYVQESPSASEARGLGTGRIFSRNGELLATVAQEGMLRIPQISDLSEQATGE